jgi:hypothetical protein
MNGAKMIGSGRATMFKWNVILCAALLVLFAPRDAVAQGDKLPHIDLQQRCRTSARATQELLGDKSLESKAFDSCLRSEQEAQAALVAAWNDIPPGYKRTCIKPRDYSPSYVEWIACLELQMDVKRLRSRN